MKHLLRNMIGIFAVTLFVLLFYACEQDPQIKKYEYPMPEVSGMSPNIGYVSSQVVITGTNFGDRTEPVKVFFGSVLATKVLMCKNNRIVVEVPDGAASGDVTMQIWTNNVGVIGQYKVLPTPYVHSVVSDNLLGTGVAEEDDVVTITGENFGTDVNDIEVSFNGTSAKEIRLVDESTIEAVTPRDWVSGNVVITIRGYAMTGNALFNPNAKGDVTSVYLKNYKQPFAKANEESWENGEWWTPADWIQNAVSFNADSSTTVSGMQYKAAEGYTLAFQHGWNKNRYANGKMYQQVKLRPGTYRLEVTYAYTKVLDGNFVAAFIVKGTEENDIPDTDQVTTLDGTKGVYAPYKTSIADGASGQLVTASFNLEEETDVLIGFLTTMNSGDNSYFKITEVKLVLE